MASDETDVINARIKELVETLWEDVHTKEEAAQIVVEIKSLELKRARLHREPIWWKRLLLRLQNRFIWKPK